MHSSILYTGSVPWKINLFCQVMRTVQCKWLFVRGDDGDDDMVVDFFLFCVVYASFVMRRIFIFAVCVGRMGIYTLRMFRSPCSIFSRPPIQTGDIVAKPGTWQWIKPGIPGRGSVRERYKTISNQMDSSN